MSTNISPALEAAVMLNASRLFAEQPIACLELVRLCRDRGHTMWGDTAAIAARYGLLESDGRPHDVVREVICARFAGEGLEMRLS